MAQLDEFLKRLLEISREFNDRKAVGLPVQDTHMCILRSDYMVDWPSIDQQPLLKLVEYNTVAVSLLPSAAKVKLLQDTLCHKYRTDLVCNYGLDFSEHFK